MAGICEACKGNITVTQKRIKCSNCSQLYHSECVNYNNESTRSQWKCPNCFAYQRKGGDNSNTPIRGAKTAKELPLNPPKNKGVTATTSSADMYGQTSQESTNPSTATSPEIGNTCTYSLSENSLVLQIENMLDVKLNLLKKDMVKEIHSSLVTEFRKDLQKINTKYNELENVCAKLHEEKEDLRKNLNTLQTKSMEDHDKILELQSQINKQQQGARMSNIEIVGLPESPNESTEDLVIAIANYAGVTLQCDQIESVHRVQPMRKVEGRPKPIVAKLQTRMLKDKIIAGLRKSNGISTRDVGLAGNNRKFFVNEHLTPENKQLLNAVKTRAKTKSFKFIWVRNCNIFLRKNEESPVITISSIKDLQKIT